MRKIKSFKPIKAQTFLDSVKKKLNSLTSQVFIHKPLFFLDCFLLIKLLNIDNSAIKSKSFKIHVIYFFKNNYK